MASLNKVFLLGNLTRDPDLRYTPSGSAVCEFGMAISRRYTVNNQEREDVCFVDIVVWAKSAENCKQYLSKGSPVLIEGRLQLDQWEDREGGGKRSRLRVVADRVQFIGSRRSADEYAEQAPDSQRAPQDRAYTPRPQQQQQYSAPRQNYAPRAPQGAAAPQGAPPPPPPMPEGAFNPSDVEDDIPF